MQQSGVSVNASTEPNSSTPEAEWLQGQTQETAHKLGTAVEMQVQRTRCKHKVSTASPLTQGP
jgi:hypothetical protein